MLVTTETFFIQGGFSMMNHQVANVRNPAKQIREDENGIAPKEGIGKEEQRPTQAQPPECDWNDNLLLFLRRVPLHHKAREEDAIPEPANDFPKMPLDPEKSARAKKELRIHERD